MSKPIKGPSGDVFAVLPGSLDQVGTEEWWVDLVEVDLHPPMEPTGDDELLPLDFMDELQLRAFNDFLICQRIAFGLGVFVWPLLRFRLWLIRTRYNRRLRRLGYPKIPRSFQPGQANERF